MHRFISPPGAHKLQRKVHFSRERSLYISGLEKKGGGGEQTGEFEQKKSYNTANIPVIFAACAQTPARAVLQDPHSHHNVLFYLFIWFSFLNPLCYLLGPLCHWELLLYSAISPFPEINTSHLGNRCL